MPVVPFLARRVTNCASVRLIMLQNGTIETVYGPLNLGDKIIQLIIFTALSKKNHPHSRIAQKLAKPLQLRKHNRRRPLSTQNLHSPLTTEEANNGQSQ
jgi:hypothetical protein